MAQRKARDIEEKEEGRRRKKTQPMRDQLKQAAAAEDIQGRQVLARVTAEQASLAKNPQVQGSQRIDAMLELQQSYGNRYVQRVMGQSLPIDHGAINELGRSLASTLVSLPNSSKPSVDSSSVGIEQQSQAALIIQRQAESGKPSSTPHPSPNVEGVEHEVRILLEPSSVQNGLLNLPLDLTVPDLPFLPTIPSTKESAAPEPKAGSATPRSAPVEPKRPKPKAGTTADVLKALTAVPAVATGLKALQTNASEQVKRDFKRLSTGEKIATLSMSVLIGGGALGGILSNPESRRFAFNQLNGKVIKVPGITALGVEFNTKGDNLMLGLHLDVGALLPPSWGFGPSSPKPIGAPPVAVQRQVESTRFQAKLIVNPPDDEYEKEADRVADAVTEASASSVRRQVDEEELVATKQASDIQRQAEEEEEEVQPKLSENQPQMVSEGLEAGINTARGSGQPLPDSVRSSLEPQLGHDFSQVHIHTDAKANKLSQQLGAEAFTTGNDVFFRDGAYQPGSESGRELIAHELTHVVQQGAARVSRQAAETEEAAADPKEEVKKAVGKITTGPKKEDIEELLHWVAKCQLLGFDAEAKKAIDEAAEKASTILKSKIATLDVKSAKEEMVRELLNAAADVMALGGDEKAVESAAKTALDWAEAQLAPVAEKLRTALDRLRATRTAAAAKEAEIAAKEVAIKAADVLLLDEATEALDLLTQWQEESTKPE